MNATVTIALSDLEKLKNDSIHKDAKIEQLTTDLADERKRAMSAENVEDLWGCLEVMYTIVTFAVANLDPLTVRGWPHADLTQLGIYLRDFLCRYDRERFPFSQYRTFERFAERCKFWEEARAEGREKEVLSEMNRGMAASPDKLAEYGIAVINEPPPQTAGVTIETMGDSIPLLAEDQVVGAAMQPPNDDHDATPT